ncbi:MAG: enoyl-CoA hydratase/isomerase family protein [Acidimicrobiia bacterium]
MADEVDLGSRFLRWELRGPAAWVTIDRPERRNALTANMYFGIRRAVDRVNASRSILALVLTGTGDAFAPGGELGGHNDDGAVNYGELLGTGVVPFDAIRDSRKPVIAAVNGLCMGGGLLIAMLADVAIASDRAVFGAPELLRGVADAYHAAILPEHVGIALARDMLFTGRRLTAPEAQRYGLVARVVPHDQLTTATEEVVHDILRAAPRARVALKRLINARYGAVDKITFDESVNGDEVIEGFRAFVEKRTPDWAPD